MEEDPRPPDRPSKTERIRENQRRSRQRKKDYISDLEKKVRQYEVEGIKASAEMQHAARKVLEHIKLLQEENQKLRQLLQTYGLSEADIEDRLRVTPRAGSSRRSSTQTTAVTALMAATTMAMATDRLESLLGPHTPRIPIPSMPPIPPMESIQDDDDDSEEDEISPVRPPTSSSRRPSRLKPARRTGDPLPSPARHSDSGLLQSGPHSISSSTTSTPSIERQSNTQDFPGTLPDPRASVSGQLAPPAQAEMYGVVSAPQHTYTYGMHPSQSPWARQPDFPGPVSMYPTQTPTYVPTDVTSPIGMLNPNVLPTTVAYQESASVPSTDSMARHVMMPAPVQSNRSRRHNPNIKPDPSGQDRWN